MVCQYASERLHGYEEDLKNEFNSYKGEFDQAVLQSRPLVQDVLWSYAMAVLQMILIYIVTSEAVQAWVLRQGMKQVQKGAERTLEEFGVADAMDDVFGARLTRVEEKILKMLRMYKQIEGMLGKANAMTNLLPDESAQQVEDVVKKAKDSSLFGFFVKK